MLTEVLWNCIRGKN